MLKPRRLDDESDSEFQRRMDRYETWKSLQVPVRGPTITIRDPRYIYRFFWWWVWMTGLAVAADKFSPKSMWWLQVNLLSLPLYGVVAYGLMRLGVFAYGRSLALRVLIRTIIIAFVLVILIGGMKKHSSGTHAHTNSAVK